MKINSQNQVTLPAEMIADMNIVPGQSSLEFIRHSDGRWYVRKIDDTRPDPKRFRNAHRSAICTMSSNEILKLTRL